jgi:hypothetical protein
MDWLKIKEDRFDLSYFKKYLTIILEILWGTLKMYLLT